MERQAHNRAVEGAGDAGDALNERVYGELMEIARERMRGERAGHTLQATALVHEAWIRVARLPTPADRAEFLRAAALAMRRILIEHARSKARLKRGGSELRGDAEWSEIADLARDEDLARFVALDESIARLEKRDPRVAEIVRLRYYAGLSVEDTAEALRVSPRTVKREWSYARAWLQRELAPRD
ncbi:MAG: sigma-70 family RNA polymerase sigma factor [Planctomycetes bacterium]|nr:sigma-70 family RNA polymerase sigma factor [Planctomycetota bacterium]